MDQLKGSLRFVPLPAVAQFIADLGGTGRLTLAQAAWSGEIAVRDGQIVAAELGSEHGRAALEGMALALTGADFAFADGPVEASEEVLLGRDALSGYLAGLVAEREQLHIGFESLGHVPCLVDQAQGAAESSQVTIDATALQLIPSLIYGHTLDQIAQRRGLARTLREVARLRAAGLVRLEVARDVPVPLASAATAGPAPRAVTSALRPPRSLRQPAPAAEPARRVTWWKSGAATQTAAAAPDLQRAKPATDHVTTARKPEPSPSDPTARTPAPGPSEPAVRSPAPGPSEPAARTPEPGQSEPAARQPEPRESEPTLPRRVPLVRQPRVAIVEPPLAVGEGSIERRRSWRATLLALFLTEATPQT